MKKFYILIITVLILNIIFLFVNSSHDTSKSSDKNKLKAGLVFDVGGRGDKSFNDSAYNGLMRAVKELGIYAEYIEPGEGADRESAIRILAAKKFDIIMGIGFIFTDDLKNIAVEYPEVNFAGVDYVVLQDEKGNDILPPPNVAALKFKEEEGSFLVGALAALCSKTGKIGFVGGMNIPLINKFEAGYKQGARYVKPDIEVVSNYAGVTGVAFKDPAKGKELGMSQYGNNADIIYHASGSTGLGVFEAAKAMNKLAIGVDADQYGDMPGHILTSMLKKVDVAVYNIIKECYDKKFTGGIKILGLKEDGVGFVYDKNNENLIPPAVYNKVIQLKEKIISGEIQIKTFLKE
ncbi:BMP family ABC transporter substrate-binding protein [Candidatus Dependentiae bacterium]|nr:BMP family ABC transporter substrate-binding protein [Candidatus Dependentiae bacterium]